MIISQYYQFLLQNSGLVSEWSLWRDVVMLSATCLLAGALPATSRAQSSPRAPLLLSSSLQSISSHSVTDFLMIFSQYFESRTNCGVHTQLTSPSILRVLGVTDGAELSCDAVRRWEIVQCADLSCSVLTAGTLTTNIQTSTSRRLKTRPDL